MRKRGWALLNPVNPMKREIEQRSKMMKLPSIDTRERLIQGSLLKCVDGHWSTSDNPAMTGHQLLGLGTIKALQRWHTDEPPETIVDEGAGLPDVKALNASIPKDTWEIGLDGQPRPPWQMQYVVFLLDPNDASLFTFANGTIGARIAWERLINRVTWMRALRGATIYPVVTLDSRPMKTQYGTKQRPEFTPTDWRDFGGSAEAAIEDQSA
jgi:hypothetical protein